MPPAGASPMSRMWQDAGRPGHDITKREAGRVTGRCAVLIMLSPTQNSHPRDGKCQFGESDTFTGTKGNSETQWGRVCPVRLQSIIRASRAIAQRLGSANNSPKPARSARSRDLLKATFELKPRIPAFCSVRRRTAL